MKRLIFTCAISSLLSVVSAAQTPVPPVRPAAAKDAGTGGNGEVGATGKIACLSTAQFHQSINELNVRIEALNAEFGPKQKELRGLEEQLQTLKNKVENQGGTVSPQVRGQWAAEAAEKERLFKRQTEDYEQLVRKRLGESTQPVYGKIRKFLEDFCQQRGIIMIFEFGAATESGLLVWSTPAADITEDFVKEYNRANPVTGTKKP
ncbi:MAG TPA: OmpH family outer membrane protein [Blastocatellia bacterium]|nr:OmpH family outer membrane protein [Blastocatellia bacterium]